MFWQTYETIAGISIAVMIGGTLGLALLFVWITGHKFGKHQDAKIALAVTGGLLGMFLMVFLAFRLVLPY